MNITKYEHAWLEAYKSFILMDHSASFAAKLADQALEEFKKRFPG